MVRKHKGTNHDKKCLVCKDKNKKQKREKIIASSVISYFFSMMYMLIIYGMLNLSIPMVSKNIVLMLQTLYIQILFLTFFILFLASTKEMIKHCDKLRDEYKVEFKEEFKIKYLWSK